MIIVQWLLLIYIFYILIEKVYPHRRYKFIEEYYNEMIFLWCSVILIIFFRNRIDVIKTSLSIIIILLLYEFLKNIQMSRKKENSQIVLYQIFSFINNQISAGLRLEDIISRIYKVVNNCEMKQYLKKEGEKYLHHYNLEEYLLNVSKKFDQEEYFSVEYAIKNALQIGMRDEVLKHQEDMMFNKYIGIIQKKGDRNKLKMFFVGMLLATILIFLISYPIFIEFMESIKNLY
ncbi:MAG: hypothetical protein U9Q80_06060 [Bacillota bacterium]|nr:hypothetical protein [Bacillota bacterium]